jgi:hypothetical protein
MRARLCSDACVCKGVADACTVFSFKTDFQRSVLEIPYTMSESELRERSLFADREEMVEQTPEDEIADLQMDVQILLEEREELQRRVDELEETNTWRLVAIVALSAFYACVMIAVVDVKNNPEL